LASATTFTSGLLASLAPFGGKNDLQNLQNVSSKAIWAPKTTFNREMPEAKWKFVMQYIRNAWPDSRETLHRYLFLHDLQFIFSESLDPSNFVF
jgi:hypothetical protein